MNNEPFKDGQGQGITSTGPGQTGQTPPMVSQTVTTTVPAPTPSPSSSAVSANMEDDQDLESDSTKMDNLDNSMRKRLFSKELRCMMYGFGDDQNPYTESVDILEDLVIEFITEVTQKAMEVGKTGRVQVEDIMHLVRKDPRKYARVKDLLSMNEELKKARKAFDEVKYAGI